MVEIGFVNIYVVGEIFGGFEGVVLEGEFCGYVFVGFFLCCVCVLLVLEVRFFGDELVVLEYCLVVVEDVIYCVLDDVFVVVLLVILCVECILEVVECVLVEGGVVGVYVYCYGLMVFGFGCVFNCNVFYEKVLFFNNCINIENMVVMVVNNKCI